MPRTFDWQLSIEIPDVPYRGLGSLGEHLTAIGRAPTGTAERQATGTLTVTDDMTYEQIRTWLVNDIAKEHVGKTVTVTRFVLTPA